MWRLHVCARARRVCARGATRRVASRGRRARCGRPDAAKDEALAGYRRALLEHNEINARLKERTRARACARARRVSEARARARGVDFLVAVAVAARARACVRARACLRAQSVKA